jgi:hypothetical protein
VLVDEAERVAELVQDDALDLVVVRLRGQPPVVHRVIVLGNALALCAEVRPRAVPLLEFDPDLGVARVDEIEGELGHPGRSPALSDRADALLERLVALHELDADHVAPRPARLVEERCPAVEVLVLLRDADAVALRVCGHPVPPF